MEGEGKKTEFQHSRYLGKPHPPCEGMVCSASTAVVTDSS